MRKIEFRVWDKQAKEIYCIGDNSYMKNSIVKCDLEISDVGLVVSVSDINGEWRFVEKYVLLQYSGFKDKEGCEIYESHIVKDNNGIAGEVYFNEECGAWGIRGGDWYGDYNNFLGVGPAKTYESLKIIGNVYENPKLLEG